MTPFWHHYGVTETSLRYHGNLLFVYIYKERKLQLVDQIYLALREKCPYSAWKVSVFGVILVCIFPHSDWIRRDNPNLSVFIPNARKCRPEWLRIRTLFTQCRWLIYFQQYFCQLFFFDQTILPIFFPVRRIFRYIFSVFPLN